MESHHRKLFRKPNVSENNTLCPNNCHPNESCFTGPIQIMPPPLLGPPPKQSTINEKHMLQNSLIITASMVGCAFLFLIFMVLKYYNSRRNNQIIRNSSNQFDRSQEFFDEERGVVIDHPFWYIITPGLGRSVIDSITVCKYKKDEGLIDGTECSVCLLEFEQDESLRLLPKCSHAFHISCIDTWLSSHQNCPLCRAPIVCENANIGQLSVPDPGFNPSSSQREEETQLENLDNNNHDQVGEEESSEEIRVEERKNKQNSMKGLCNSSPVLRILTDKELIRGEEIQPITRSVSLDSSSALRIYHDVGSVISDQGSSKSIVKKSQLGTVSKQENKNLSLDKLMKSSSMGNSLQKRSILMKRSFSSSRKKKNFNQIPCRSLNSNLS